MRMDSQSYLKQRLNHTGVIHSQRVVHQHSNFRLNAFMKWKCTWCKWCKCWTCIMSFVSIKRDLQLHILICICHMHIRWHCEHSMIAFTVLVVFDYYHTTQTSTISTKFNYFYKPVLAGVSPATPCYGQRCHKCILWRLIDTWHVKLYEESHMDHPLRIRDKIHYQANIAPLHSQTITTTERRQFAQFSLSTFCCGYVIVRLAFICFFFFRQAG